MDDASRLTAMSGASRYRGPIKPLARCQRDYSAPHLRRPEILDLAGRQHGVRDDLPAMQVLVQWVDGSHFVPDTAKAATAAVDASDRFMSATANRTTLCGIGFILGLYHAADTLKLVVQRLLELAQRVVAVLLVRVPRPF
jgi:hypothetical protein